MNLTWFNKDNTSNMLIMVFKKDTDNRFVVGNINLTLPPSEETFPHIKGKLKLPLIKALNIVFSVSRFITIKKELICALT